MERVTKSAVFDLHRQSRTESGVSAGVQKRDLASGFAQVFACGIGSVTPG
jgi:hypothetical protein